MISNAYYYALAIKANYTGEDMKNKLDKYQLRLDPEVKMKAERQAKKERRSLNAWLQLAVDDRLERAEQGVQS